MNNINIKNITPYQDINEILLVISKGIANILDKNLIGLYLFGSLVYGNFNRGSSDIDLVAIIDKPLNKNELERIKKLHKQIEEQFPQWKERIECSYLPSTMLNNILPPKQPRPYYGGGIFYAEAPYGNEWIINNYLLFKHSIALIGNDFKTLIQPIDIKEVQKACIRDLFQEWEPKITDSEWLNNSHYQSYIILNLCRILYTVICSKVSTKKVSSDWVKNTFMQWKNLIETAQKWEYGKIMALKNQTINFIKFSVDIVKQTTLYHEMQDELINK